MGPEGAGSRSRGQIRPAADVPLGYVQQAESMMTTMISGVLLTVAVVIIVACAVVGLVSERA